MFWLRTKIQHIKCKHLSILLILMQIWFLIWISRDFLFSKDDNVQILTWWTPLIPEKKRVIHCYNDKFKCLVTSDRGVNSKAFLFYGSYFQAHDVPLPRTSSLWALYHEESPKNVALFLFQETQRIFNVTATFSRHSDFPLTSQYLPSLYNITDTTYYIDIHTKNGFLKEFSPVLYLQSNCDTPVQRDLYVIELMKYVEIDSYGLCLNNKPLPSELAKKHPLDFYNEELLKFIAKYKFTLAIENSICNDYITEKLWRPLIAGSVPIYLGSPCVEDWLPNNTSAVLLNKYRSPKEAAAFINLLNDNDTLYEQYMKHKSQKMIRNTQLINDIANNRQNEDSLILQFECFTCRSLHEGRPKVVTNSSVFECPTPENIRQNPWVSHWILGKCQNKAFVTLVEKNKGFTKEQYETEWWSLYESGNC